MKLPFSLPFTKQQNKEYFLALLLKEEKVNAVVFEETAGKIHVIGQSEEYFSLSLEKIPLQEFLDVLDKAIAHAEESLPTDVQTHKTIFGVKETWVQDSKIKKEYLVKLKAVCDALELTPVGFIVMQEAIAHFLQQEEGAPVSAILVEVGKKDLEVCLLRAGRVLEIYPTPIKESVVHTVDAVLHHFQYEVLPSRIILLESEHHKGLSQAFITHTWSRGLPFLHVPQITTLPKGFDAKAVIFGAAAQMGFEIVGNIADTAAITQSVPFEDAVLHKNAKGKIGEEKDMLYTHETFGFVKNADIINKEAQEINETASSAARSDSGDAEWTKEPEIREPENTSEQSGSFMEKVKQFPLLLPTFFRGISFPQSHRLGAIFSHMPFSIRGKTKLVLIPPVLLAIFLLVVLFYIFGLKATVALSVKPNVIEQDATVALATTGATDFSQNTIGLKAIEVSEDGKVSAPATGKKETGTKAKGSITLLSSLRKEQTIPKGTAVTSSSGSIFTFDDDVKIASSSGLSNLISVKVAVTAKDIGKESNLPSGAKFTVSSFDTSEIEAKNDSAFSGGTKKEITVVSKADIDSLTEELPTTLQEKATEEMNKKISEKQKLLPLPAVTTVSKEDFSKKVGDEATTITLTGTVTYTGFVYTESDVEDFVKTQLKKNTQEKDATPEGVSYEIKNIKQKDEAITATLQMKGFFLPKLDTKKVTDSISGKSFTEAKTTLSQLPQVTDSSITLHPSLPFIPSLLPRLSSNITLVIEKQ